MSDPIRKVGGGGGGGGQSTSSPIYEKCWGGGGQFASGPILKVGGGGGGGGGGQSASGQIPLFGTQLHVPIYVLPRYTSYARANELKIHAGKGYFFFSSM